MENLEALRLHQGLAGVVQALFEAFRGTPLELPPGTGAQPQRQRRVGMVTTPGEFIPAPSSPGPRSGHRLEIEPVRDLEGLEQARRVAVAGNGPGPLSAVYVPQVAAIPGMRIYLGRVEGEPVTTAVGWTAIEAKGASAATGIFQVVTTPASRGKGYGGAVTSRAVLDGFAAGADLAWLQANDLGQGLYENLGFRRVEPPIPPGGVEDSPRIAMKILHTLPERRHAVAVAMGGRWRPGRRRS